MKVFVKALLFSAAAAQQQPLVPAPLAPAPPQAQAAPAALASGENPMGAFFSFIGALNNNTVPVEHAANPSAVPAPGGQPGIMGMMAAANEGVAAINQVADVAKTVFKPEEVLNAAAQQVHDLPETVKADIKHKMDDMIKTMPSDIVSFMHQKAEHLTHLIPEDIKKGFKEDPNGIAKNAEKLVSQLSPEAKQDMMDSLRDMMLASVNFVAQHPNELTDKLNDFMQHLPPQFTNIIVGMQDQLQKQAETVAASVPPGALAQLTHSMNTLGPVMEQMMGGGMQQPGMPQMPQQMMGYPMMGQQPQMQMPQMNMFASMMPQMMQMPQMMPQMPMQMPQMPQMGGARPSAPMDLYLPHYDQQQMHMPQQNMYMPQQYQQMYYPQAAGYY